MSDDDYQATRKGPGISWNNKHYTGFGTREESGYTIDNLDTKILSEAENNFEQIFVLVRQSLEENESCCMDNEEDRLRCTQEISERIAKHLSFRGRQR